MHNNTIKCPKCSHSFEYVDPMIQEKLDEKLSEIDEENESILNAKLRAQEKAQRNEITKELSGNYQSQMNQIIAERMQDIEQKHDLEKKGWQIKDERNKKQISDLNNNMNRSQDVELKGESAEETIKDRLCERFIDDKIQDVPKGVKGADFQMYIYPNGRDYEDIGKILIEVKDTKTFQSIFIDKLQQDVRDSDAMIGVIITTTMPKKYEDRDYFEHHGSKPRIIILRMKTAIDSIEMLREELISSNSQEIATLASGNDEITQEVFKYITTDGKDHLSNMRLNIDEQQKLLNEKDKQHHRSMKKEQDNLDKQKEIFQELGKGFDKSFRSITFSTLLTD